MHRDDTQQWANDGLVGYTKKIRISPKYKMKTSLGQRPNLNKVYLI